jgi:hypothetical protein
MYMTLTASLAKTADNAMDACCGVPSTKYGLLLIDAGTAAGTGGCALRVGQRASIGCCCLLAFAFLLSRNLKEFSL